MTHKSVVPTTTSHEANQPKHETLRNARESRPLYPTGQTPRVREIYMFKKTKEMKKENKITRLTNDPKMCRCDDSKRAREGKSGGTSGTMSTHCNVRRHTGLV
mmetsp:Transcript_3656/g.7659  ORF Transcript_3656/g.7659 Transcript_3656/m.7659 type:complete len:103 (+) Transcript_3656:350-658(+)